MSDALSEGPASTQYLDLLHETDDGAERASKDGVARVVSRAHQQLALRDVLGVGFGGLVGVLLSLLAAAARHLHRRNHAPNRIHRPGPAGPKKEI